MNPANGLEEMAPIDIMPHVHAAAHLALSGKAQRFESSRALSDGSIGYGEVSYIPDIDVDGSVVGLFSLATDIKPFKKAHEEQKLATEVFQNISEGITITDANHTLVTVSPSFCKMTDYTPDEVIGRAPRFLYPHHDDSIFYDTVSKL